MHLNHAVHVRTRLSSYLGGCADKFAALTASELVRVADEMESEERVRRRALLAALDCAETEPQGSTSLTRTGSQVFTPAPGPHRTLCSPAV